MIDRAARDSVISAFEGYLDEELTAFEFDDRLQSIETEDETVSEAVSAAWFHYDDCKDHKINLTRQEWNYFQRLLLILRSDAELSATVSRRWSWDHLLAWSAVVVFIIIAIAVGWGWHLLIWGIPFGVLSVLISVYRRRKEPDLSTSELACVPFRSYSEIKTIRRLVPELAKRPYRQEIGERKVRSRAGESFNWTYAYLCWILVGPVALLFQGLPTVSDYGLSLPEA